MDLTDPLGAEDGRADRAEARPATITAPTDTGLSDRSVEALFGELLDRVRATLDVDTAAVLLLDRRAQTLVATAARGLEEEVRQGVTVPLEAGFAGRIAAAKQPVVIDHVDHTTVVNPLLIAKGIKAMAGVPLLDGGDVVGVLHVGSLLPRDFTAGDVELLQQAADRIARVAGSRLVAVERDAAIALQRGLLPGRLPTISGLSTSARYVPGGGNAVGGDWYDLFPLPGGHVGVVVGDVSGHGLHAAIVMGRVRSALRAYALESAQPEDVLTRLDAKLRHFEAGEMATVVYGVLDPTFRRLRVTCAGHLPPILAGGPAGTGQRLELVVDPPIGVVGRTARHAVDVDLDPGAVLCFYTDGLVERRGEDLEAGIDLLASWVRAGAPATVAADVMAEFVGTTVLDDDLALLVLATDEVDVDVPFELCVPADPEVLAGLRAAVRRWLAATPASEAEAQTFLVALGEATANAVEHAYGPEGGPVEVRLELVDGAIVARVADRGDWRPARGEHRGRGAMLMRGLCDEVDVEQGETGTTVRLRLVLKGSA